MNKIHNSIKRLHIPAAMLHTYWKSSANVLGAVIIGKLLSFVWKVYIARQGPTSLGLVEITMTVLFTLSSFSLLGLHTALIRFVTIATSKNAHNAARTLLLLALRISTSLALCIVAFFLLFPEALPRLIHASSSQLADIQHYIWVVPIMAATEIFWAYLAAIKHTNTYALIKYIGPPFFRIAALYTLITIGVNGRQSLIVHPVIAACLTFLLTLYLLRKQIAPSAPLAKKHLSKFFAFSLPMNGSFVLFVLYKALDTILVARYLGPTYIGLLASLVLISDIPNALFIPLLDIFQAHMGNAHTSIRKGALFTTANSAIFFLIGASMCLMLYLFRQNIIQVFLGREYFQIIPFVGIFLFLNLLETTIILPIRHFLDFYGHVRITLFLMGIATVVKCVVGIRFIPTLGLWGVLHMQIWATAIHLVSCLIAAWFVTKSNNQKVARQSTPESS